MQKKKRLIINELVLDQIFDQKKISKLDDNSHIWDFKIHIIAKSWYNSKKEVW